MSAALLCGMQANATQQMRLFGRIGQRWGVFGYTLTMTKTMIKKSFRAYISGGQLEFAVLLHGKVLWVLLLQLGKE